MKHCSALHRRVCNASNWEHISFHLTVPASSHSRILSQGLKFNYGIRRNHPSDFFLS